MRAAATPASYRANIRWHGDPHLGAQPIARHPEPFSGKVVQGRKALGEEQLPVVRLLDLRRTHATLLLGDGVPVEVVSERLGHASATITLTVHEHVHPAWAARRPTASSRCSRADPRRGLHGRPLRRA